MYFLRPFFNNCGILLRSQSFLSQPKYFDDLVRCKSRKAKGKQNQEEEEDSDDEEQMFVGKGVDVRSHVVGSMRADLLLKLGLNMARKFVNLWYHLLFNFFLSAK